MNNFTSVKISEIGRVVTGKTPPTRDKTNYGSEYMFIGPTDLHQHFVINNSQKTISEKGISCIKGSILNQLSILVGCIGWDMGNVALVKEKCATNQQINSITDVKDQYNPYYIYYWLTGKKEFLFQQANVTRTPILNKTDFSKIEIPIPEKQQQDKISSVLTALDDKIALNNKINAELEGMAKLLYDYWFIQYDFPISAEQAKSMGDPALTGKPYKSNGGPLTHNKTLKRDIPEDWEDSTVETIIGTAPRSSKIARTKYNEEGKIPIVDQSSNFICGFTDDEDSLIKAIHPFIIFGDHTRIVKLIDFDFARGADGTQILFSNHQSVPQYLFHQILKSIDLSSYGYARHFKFLKLQKITIPSESVAQNYEKKVKPFYSTIENNRKQNHHLTTLRDWLLPMLMNGQVTVK
ncbi:MAG: type I restriction enzyme S subunit [Rubritalea sp.]|jgi:type I restriction enzyme S subunit